MSKKYESLSINEKWEWHADVYAFRRIFLNVPRDEYTSPCDPNGEWYDETLVAAAERRKRIKLDDERKAREKYASDPARGRNRRLSEAEMIRGGRAVLHEWATKRGHKNFKEYMAAQGLDFDNDEQYGEACRRVSASILASPQRIPRPAGGKLEDPHAVAAALGVKAWEPTPEQLRAGRIALGLEQSKAAE